MRAGTTLFALVLPATLTAQRSLDGNRLISTDRPAAVLEVAREFSYAGTQTFELYGVATAEQHFFVELDGNRIRRLLWIQYEGYLPSNTQTYQYRDETVSHSGRSWHRRVSAVRVPDTEPRPDSDGARARAFLRAKGWSIGPDILLERLVWLLDTPPRNELMVIYMEDLADQGLTAAEVSEGGSARHRWAELSEAFHRRATESFRVTPR
jgi:hypothetical protein